MPTRDQTDHVEEARKEISAGDQCLIPHDEPSLPHYVAAQVHASLAIAERLSDIAHELEELNVRLTR